MAWTPNEIPDLSHHTIVITGANSGLGYEAAVELAKRNANVVLACRTPSKAHAALESIQQTIPSARLSIAELDLADLASIRACAEQLRNGHSRIDVLINNAGVMDLPKCQTADGFEMQFGTNHLGHFALTGLLMESLLKASKPRIVTVSSHMHRIGKIHFDDLQWERRYNGWAAYGQSKLANLLFTYELDKRLKEAGCDAAAVACHPGYAATNLQTAGPKMAGSKFMEGVANLSNKILAQDSNMGAWPTLYAAVEPLTGGEYIGPSGFMEMAGPPKRVGRRPKARDPEVARRLWEVSAQLTGVEYRFERAEAESQASELLN